MFTDGNQLDLLGCAAEILIHSVARMNKPLEFS